MSGANKIIHPGTLSDLKDLEIYRACFAEFMNLFIFCVVSAGCVIVATSGIIRGNVGLTDNALLCIALAHGLCIAVLIYATGNISGGHINPAVTIALAVRGVISVTRGLLYIMAQIGGAITGAFFLRLILPLRWQGRIGLTAVNPAMNSGQAFGLEFSMTFFLVIVVFLTAVDEQGAGQMAPLAIGMAVIVCHLVAVPWTGASMNPARSFGPAVAVDHWEDHWVYWVGPIVGALFATFIYTVAFEFRKMAPKTEDEGKPQYDRVGDNKDKPEEFNRARTRTRLPPKD